MAVRMPSARKMPELTPVYAWQVDPDKKPRDHYSCKHCVANVYFRQAHSRNGRNLDAIFYSHNLHPHENNCSFNVPATIRNAVQRSTPFRKSGRIVQNDGGITLRLKVFDDVVQAIGEEIPRETPQSNPETRSTDATRTENRHAPYLRGANDIIRLMSASDDYEDISRYLHLDYNDQRVGWRDFYYGFGELDRLYQYLDDRNVNHPVFAVLHVNKIMTWKGKQAVICHSEEVLPPNGTGIKIVPAVFSDNPLVSNAIMQNTHIGVCAMARIDGRNIGYSNFSRLVFEVKSMAQFAEYPI